MTAEELIEALRARYFKRDERGRRWYLDGVASLTDERIRAMTPEERRAGLARTDQLLFELAASKVAPDVHDPGLEVRALRADIEARTLPPPRPEGFQC